MSSIADKPWQIWESGEPNFYTITVDDQDWVMRIQMNGTYTVSQQREMLSAIVDKHNKEKTHVEHR